MLQKIDLIIEGDPVPWKAHAGYGRKAFNPRFKEREYFQWVIKSQYNGPILECAVRADFIFLMKIPISISKKRKEGMLRRDIQHTVRPDRGNLLKFTEDCLIGIIIADDSQIFSGSVQKAWGEKPRTFIRITPYDNDGCPLVKGDLEDE